MERKTTVATIAAYIASAGILEVLMLVNGDNDLLGFLPDFAEALLIPTLPTLVAAVAAYKARHVPGTMSESAHEAVAAERRGK